MLDFFYNLHWNISRTREFPGLRRALSEITKEGGFSPQDWREAQGVRLRKVLSFAGSRVPHYRRVFEESGFNPERSDPFDEIKKLPLLTKQVIQSHPDGLLAENAAGAGLAENATGGSTGAPLKFFQDRHYRTVSAALDSYVRQWWGIAPYDRTALIWGADKDFHELSMKERIYEWRYRIRGLNAFRMNEKLLLEFCRMLMRWRPPYLMGYSSALEAMAECAVKNGMTGMGFKAIRSTAETLWPHQRRLIEEAFNGPVYNFYGSREVNNLAAECPEGRRMHLISTWRYVEIADENGRRLPDGVPGHIIVTDMSNFGMPFIRYMNDDIGSISAVPCPCGRPSPVLDELLGRSSDMVRTLEGGMIHGEFFTHLFYGCAGIRQFQVHQTGLERIVVRYVPSGAVEPDALRRIGVKIRERVGAGVNVMFEECAEIPTPPSGKYRFTISDIKPAGGAGAGREYGRA